MRQSTLSSVLGIVFFLLGCQFQSPRPVVFASDRDSNWEIYILEAGSHEPVNLTNHDDIDQDPALSPDGQQILFTSNRDDNADIYRMEKDGNNVTRLTEHPAWERQARWSPDGQQIALVSDRDENQEIYLMDANGKNMERLTQNPAPDYEPVWSPDGASLVFVSERHGPPEFYLFDLKSKTQTRLTKDPRWKSHPRWSPDGQRLTGIVVEQKRHQPFEIPAQGGPLKLISVPGNTLEQTWLSPKEWLITKQNGPHTQLFKSEWPSLQSTPLYPNSQWDRQPDF